MIKVFKSLILFLIGGSIYICLELAWRGYTHWTMFIVGGIAFLLIGGINEKYNWDLNFWIQCLMSTLAVTAIEFFSGLVINIWLNWNIWRYNKLDLLGQISLFSSAAWYVLSAVGIVIDDFLRWILFGEEKPHYKFF